MKHSEAKFIEILDLVAVTWSVVGIILFWKQPWNIHDYI